MTWPRNFIVIWLWGLGISQAGPAVQAQDADTRAGHRYFGIQVVDRQTGRGVPLVTLTTVNRIRHVTDSAGWIAFAEPGLMDQPVYFFVESPGYSLPADGFGFRGRRLQTVPGMTARIEIDRSNLAERLYRITGQGIYRDSVLLSRPVPLRQPLLDGGVLGQDTVQAAIFHGRIHWFWGDTNRASYPLGNFKTSGATSALPSAGGRDPADGIDLEYAVDDQGFSRQMAPIEGPGVVWIHGLFVLNDAASGEQMFAHYSRRKSLTEQLEHGLVQFDDQTGTFVKVTRFADDARLFPRGQALHYSSGEQPYIYFASPWPTVRVPAEPAAVADVRRYEAWTCLQPGTGYEGRDSRIERDGQGNAVWDWKAATQPLTARQQAELVQGDVLRPPETRLWITPQPAEPAIPDLEPELHSGSVSWNEYRNRWVMIGLQVGGEHSFLGDVWYAESDQLTGPWVNARRIVVHDKYSFYNPAQHPFFDQRGGRDIYFQGTYTTMFSAAPVATPRYDYNQVMYRLSLDSTGLDMPVLEKTR